MFDKPLIPKPLNRRRLITASLAALCGITYWRSSAAPPKHDAAAFATRIMRLLGFSQSLDLTAASVADSESEVASVLNVDRSAIPQYASLTDRALRRYLHKRIKLDYRTGAIVSVHGWWLSATEYHALNLANHLQYSAQPKAARIAQDNQKEWHPLQKRPHLG